ncbi:MAG: hypothetical protein Kow00114_33410 [Kiloniellaceae bacterium]
MTQSTKDSDGSDHDWDRQREETAWVWNDLRSKGVDFERAYKLDLQFLPSNPTADRRVFAESLRALEYEVKFYRDDPTVEATSPAMVLTIESIWQHEQRTTEIALRCGFRPDGWGFTED